MLELASVSDLRARFLPVCDNWNDWNCTFLGIFWIHVLEKLNSLGNTFEIQMNRNI